MRTLAYSGDLFSQCQEPLMPSILSSRSGSKQSDRVRTFLTNGIIYSYAGNKGEKFIKMWGFGGAVKPLPQKRVFVQNTMF